MLALLYSLVPTIIVLTIALITKRLNIAFLIGLMACGLVASHGSLTGSFSLIGKRLMSQIDMDMILLYTFLSLLGILIVSLERSGGIAAGASYLSRFGKSPRAVECTSFLLSCAFCIDDYLSILTTGAIMRPMTDAMRIPRAKLAWLIRSLAGPLVIIAPLSTWLAMITAQLDQAGVHALVETDTKIHQDAYVLFLQSTPFIFYSLLTLITVFTIIWFRLSYGPMHHEEEIAQKTGNLFDGKESIASTSHATTPPSSIALLIIPLITLISSFIIGIAYSGGHTIFGGTHTFIEALKSTSSISLILVISALIAGGVSILLGFSKKVVQLHQLPELIYAGIAMMISSMTIIFLASLFGAMTRLDVQTGTHLAHTLSGTVQPWLLPLIFYGGAIITGFITGSAWGTIALWISIALQMTISLLGLATPVSGENISLLLPILGAVFSGAVCGNHLSLLADTAIMTATSAGCYVMDHIITQFWYIVPVIIGTATGYLICGLLLYAYHLPLLLVYLFSGAGALAIIFILLFLLSWKFKKAY